MGVKYIAANSEYHQKNMAVFTAADRPISYACWFKKPSLGVAGDLFFVGRTDSDDGYFRIIVSSDNKCYVIIRTSSTAFAATTTTIMADKWHLLTAVEESITSRTVWLDGKGKATNADSRTPINMNTTTIGRRSSLVPINHFDGSIAYMTIWKDYALTDADSAALAAGLHPLKIQPDKIIHFWPLFGDGPADIRVRDIVGNIDLDDTIGGTPTKVDSLKLRVGRFF